MAKYTAEITDKTKVETLNFMGVDFKQTWVPAPYGTATLEKCFMVQVQEMFPVIPTSILDLIDEVNSDILDDSQEILKVLAEYEETHKST